MQLKTRVAILMAAVYALAAAPVMALVPPGVSPYDFGESQYAVVHETYADREKVRQGEDFILALRLTPFKNDDFEFHLYGMEETGNPDYMLPVFQMEEAPGVTWTVEYPKGELVPLSAADKAAGKKDTYILHGQQVVLIRGKVAPDAEPGDRTFKAQFMFNTCTDEMCLAPSQLALEWPVEVVKSDYSTTVAVIPEDQLIAAVEVPAERWSLMPEITEEEGGGELALAPQASTDTAALDAIEPQGAATIPLSKALLLALLGGLILNFMPCVLPVVSIKVISLARHAQESPGTVIKQGLVFCLGIIATFLALALVVNIIQAGGTKLGWGFQFQDWRFLIVMSTIIFAFGLSLAGVYTIKPPSSLTEAGEKLSEKEGYAGSFFKGVLATVLGTPCVGPFLGPALGYAFTQSAAAVWLIFLAVGVGMAIPYALLVSNPKFLNMGQRERGKLTRSIMDAKGWLVDFERVMAFVLFATVLYLLNILAGSMGGNAVVWAIAFLLGVAFALWVWGRLIASGRRMWIVTGLIVAPLMIATAGILFLPRVQPPAIASQGSRLAWEEFSEQALTAHLAAGKTVLIDFTADWCPNCKTNEAVALNVPETKDLVAELGVVVMEADWTAMDPEISRMLRRLGYASIPLTAIFPGNDPTRPILLDGLYTPSKLHEQLRRAIQASAPAGDDVEVVEASK
jgi:thiol:disulfide interchange protein